MMPCFTNLKSFDVSVSIILLYLCFNKLEIDNCFVLVACEFTAFGDIVGHVVPHM
jgi:hypothetical protein